METLPTCLFVQGDSQYERESTVEWDPITIDRNKHARPLCVYLQKREYLEMLLNGWSSGLGSTRNRHLVSHLNANLFPEHYSIAKGIEFLCLAHIQKGLNLTRNRASNLEKRPLSSTVVQNHFSLRTRSVKKRTPQECESKIPRRN